MARPGRAGPRAEPAYGDGLRDRRPASRRATMSAFDEVFPDAEPRSRAAPTAGRLPAPGGVAGRRTVTITGQGAEGYATRNGTRPSAAARHSQLKRHERSGFRPDRAAMWAVLLGVVLILAAATSSHAAVLDARQSLARTRLSIAGAGVTVPARAPRLLTP